MAVGAGIVSNVNRDSPTDGVEEKFRSGCGSSGREVVARQAGHGNTDQSAGSNIQGEVGEVNGMDDGVSDVWPGGFNRAIIGEGDGGSERGDCRRCPSGFRSREIIGVAHRGDAIGGVVFREVQGADSVGSAEEGGVGVSIDEDSWGCSDGGSKARKDI